jgi:hypothetical protein
MKHVLHITGAEPQFHQVIGVFIIIQVNCLHGVGDFGVK